MSIIQKRINSSILILFQNLTADLQTFVNINDLPELLLSVCYNANLLRLTVNVVEGKNFKVSSQQCSRCLAIHNARRLKNGRALPIFHANPSYFDDSEIQFSNFQ